VIGVTIFVGITKEDDLVVGRSWLPPNGVNHQQEQQRFFARLRSPVFSEVLFLSGGGLDWMGGGGGSLLFDGCSGRPDANI